MYRCPFCHSTNIEQERDYNELKIELKRNNEGKREGYAS